MTGAILIVLVLGLPPPASSLMRGDISLRTYGGRMAGPVSVNTVTTRCPHPATVSPVLAPPRPGVVCSTD